MQILLAQPADMAVYLLTSEALSEVLPAPQRTPTRAETALGERYSMRASAARHACACTGDMAETAESWLQCPANLGNAAAITFATCVVAAECEFLLSLPTCQLPGGT
mmetsp:Transcript_24053/g.54818  ORF Transcript_24053/g.54818 Transcript_24053/m.54818 type:complete len:107 (-) Transcript_24053:1132-1452(-)